MDPSGRKRARRPPRRRRLARPGRCRQARKVAPRPHRDFGPSRARRAAGRAAIGRPSAGRISGASSVAPRPLSPLSRSPTTTSRCSPRALRAAGPEDHAFPVAHSQIALAATPGRNAHNGLDSPDLAHEPVVKREHVTDRGTARARSRKPSARSAGSTGRFGCFTGSTEPGARGCPRGLGVEVPIRRDHRGRVGELVRHGPPFAPVVPALESYDVYVGRSRSPSDRIRSNTGIGMRSGVTARRMGRRWWPIVPNYRARRVAAD